MLNQVQLHRLDLNLLVVFEVLMDERSVTRAADRLGKTPSAVSHALGRLREQVGDPLMVKVGGVMQPSPFALELIEEVRPILRSIQRVVQAPQPFDPATSHRVFRIAVPVSASLVSDVFGRVYSEAPEVGLEWVPPSRQTAIQVAEEQVDIALLGTDESLPDGLSEEALPPSARLTFARRGHPATERWNKEAWLHWPHIVVGMAHAYRSTVEERVAKLGIERRVGARVPDLACVAPLLARTNMIVNHPPTWLVDDIDTHDLQVMEPPVPLGSLTLRFVWSSRLGNDPGNRWIRRIVMASFRDMMARAEARVAAMPLIRAQRE
jgi:LysR family transcriptional activator of mexEF-oprN operon